LASVFLMNIGGLQKLTLIDFPGKIACTVFLAGCNFRCPFCYNVSLVLPEVIEKHFPLPEKEFFDFLREKKDYLEGVCLSGGEPTIHPDLPSFCEKIKKLGYSLKLDTNGSHPALLKELIDRNLVDYIAMDVKASPGKYPKLIGFKNCASGYLLDKVSRSINLLKEGRVDYEFRTTVVPGLLSKNDVIKIGRWLAPAKKYVLQNFKPGRNIESKLEKAQPYSDEYLFSIKKALEPFFELVQIR